MGCVQNLNTGEAGGRTASHVAWRGLTLSAVMAVAVALAGCNKDVYANLDAGAAPATAGEGKPLAAAGNVPPDASKIQIAKKQFRERNFGLAEKAFRDIIESQPRNAEAWLGLAASYDQLRRFKLADRAYGQVVKLDGPSVALYNNRGYSYLLRGDRKRARRDFRKARNLEPGNLFVKNNLRILNKRR